MNLLSDTVYEVEKIEDIDLDDQKLEHSDFVGCKFKHISASETAWLSCSFRDCKFIDSNLDLMKVDRSVFQSVQFTNCKMMGINWTNASWWGRQGIAQLIKKINFKDCVLNYSSFMGLNLAGIKIVGCIVHEVDFSEAILSKADFSDSDLTKAIFRSSDLRKADFRKAKNYAFSPLDNKINKARFSLPEAMSLLHSMDIELE